MEIKKNYFDDIYYKEMLKKDSEIFGLDSSHKWNSDPRQFFISQARYKFVAKILSGEKSVLEIGSADGFNSRIVAQEVQNLELTDNEITFKHAYEKHIPTKWKKNYFIHDFIKKSYYKKYSAIYMLDVLEHINQKFENKFIRNIIKSLNQTGTLVIGVPTLEFQKFSPKNKGHINCKTGEDLKNNLKKYFHNVFLFSMNDEVVSTSFTKMACYSFLICCNKKK